jgi:RHS repeat-associated protein
MVRLLSLWFIFTCFASSLAGQYKCRGTTESWCSTSGAEYSTEMRVYGPNGFYLHITNGQCATWTYSNAGQYQLSITTTTMQTGNYYTGQCYQQEYGNCYNVGTDYYGNPLCSCSSQDDYYYTVLDPGIPTISAPSDVWAGQSFGLTVINPVAGVSYRWYTQAVGGTVVYTGVSWLHSGLPEGNYTRWVESYTANEQCTSQRVSVSIYSSPYKYNTVRSINYDLQGTQVANIIGEAMSFTDMLGRARQSQAKEVVTDRITISETVYDAMNRPALSTLAVPTTNPAFGFDYSFLKGYDYTKFDVGTKINAPDPIDPTAKLGEYYSSTNNSEPLTPNADGFPFSRTEFFSDPSGAVRRSGGPGHAFKIGSGRESRSYTLPVLDELNHYSVLKSRFAIGSPIKSLERVATKTVVRDAHGREAVSFADQDGKTLATALVGPEGVTSPHLIPIIVIIPAGEYLDIHLPAGYADFALSGEAAGTATLQRRDDDRSFTTSELTGSSTQRPTGFFRIRNTHTTAACTLAYKLIYHGWTYHFYDLSGRLLATIPPIQASYGLSTVGADLTGATLGAMATYNYMPNTFRYNGAGWLISETTPDGGETQFVYRRDGTLRFSQNALQRASSRYSFIMLDAWGRTTEIGEFSPSAGQPKFFAHGVTPPAGEVSVHSCLEPASQNSLPNNPPQNETSRRERTYYLYDVAAPDFTSLGLPSRITGQRFLPGRLSKSWNSFSETYFSYNADGQIEWKAQKLPGLPAGQQVKWTEMHYDALGRVDSTVFMPHVAAERFVHANRYDRAGRLIESYTREGNKYLGTIASPASWNGLLVQTKQSYYLHGALKRLELGGSTQGLDYTYTLQGSLKSVNSPQLSPEEDPGRDGYGASPFTRDAFGYSLDYFPDDVAEDGQVLADAEVIYVYARDSPEAIDIKNFIESTRGSLTWEQRARQAIALDLTGGRSWYTRAIAWHKQQQRIQITYLFVRDSPEGIDIKNHIETFRGTTSWEQYARQSIANDLQNGGSWYTRAAGWYYRHRWGTSDVKEIMRFISEAPNATAVTERNRIKALAYSADPNTPLRWEQVLYDQSAIHAANSNSTVRSAAKAWFNETPPGAPRQRRLDYPPYDKHPTGEQVIYLFFRDAFEGSGDRAWIEANRGTKTWEQQARETAKFHAESLTSDYEKGSLAWFHRYTPEVTDVDRAQAYIMEVDGGARSWIIQSSPGTPVDLGAWDVARFHALANTQPGIKEPALAWAAKEKPTLSPNYDGNIQAMRWRTEYATLATPPPGADPTSKAQNMYGFTYDSRSQLHNAFFGSRTAGTPFTRYPDARYDEFGLTYDPNGNILTLNRNAYQAPAPAVSPAIDRLTYLYKPNTNQLRRITDTQTHPNENLFKDIRNQTADAYTYDVIGQLTTDASEGISQVYDAYGLVKEVYKKNAQAVDIKLLEFLYDDGGARVAKRTYTSTGTLLKTTWYLGGMIYEQVGTSTTVTQIEVPIPSGTFYRSTGEYVYSLSDHLGNVRAVVPRGFNPASLQATLNRLKFFSDYYPFGWGQPGRDQGLYRYGYQGQEKDPETNWNAFQLRMYDGRLGRWMTTDPAGQYYSPYLAMGNNPGNGVDPDGAFFNPIFDEFGAFLGTDELGLQGEAIIMKASDFTQGMSHAVALSKGTLFSQFKFTNPLGQGLISAQLNNFPSRPDWDGILTKSEADKWYTSNMRSPLYVDMSKLDIASAKDMFANKPNGTSVYPNFIYDLTNTGDVFGHMQVTLVDRLTGEVKLGTKNYLDIYDFDYKPVKNLEILLRNILVAGGDPGKGTSFMIHGYGKPPLLGRIR